MSELPYAYRIRTLHEHDLLRLLADETRLSVLRHLMAEAATLSQLSKLMGSYPARLRHHLKLLEEAGLIAMVSTRVGHSYLEKYYEATARAFVINLTILPILPQKKGLVIWGSDDLLLERLAHSSHELDEIPNLYSLPVGSLDGLIALRQGLCQIAGCHLLDRTTGQYNIAHVRALFPGWDVHLVTLAHRSQGLLVGPGNPLEIQGVHDLTRPDLTFANRLSGSGTRLWLEAELQKRGILPGQIRGFETTLKTHKQVGEAVAEGKADVGLALAATARPFQLDFIPLFSEPFQLVFMAREANNPAIMALLAFLQTERFRTLAASLDGYDLTESGKVTVVQA